MSDGTESETYTRLRRDELAKRAAEMPNHQRSRLPWVVLLVVALLALGYALLR